MADITKCDPVDCPVKEKCYRFTSQASEYQSYFAKQPSEIIDGKFTCDMYWGENAQNIWNMLKKATGYEED